MTGREVQYRAIGGICFFQAAGLLTGCGPFDQTLKISGSLVTPNHVRPADS